MDFIDMFLNIITKYGLTQEQALLAVEKAFEVKIFRNKIAEDYSSSFLGESIPSISDKD